MSRQVVLAALVTALAASLGGLSSARAYRRSETNWSPGALPISYRVNEGSAPASIGAAGARSAVDAGFASWAGPACTTWRATNAGTSAIARPRLGDRENSIAWISGAWPAELGAVDVTIGITPTTWTVGGYFNESDIMFNNVGFTWSLDGRSGTVDTQSIATHEEGHFLGLDHPPVPAAVMYASYSGGIKRALNADDISGVCAIYPSGVAVPDAGMTSSDPCGGYTSCAGCTPNAGCGWCGGERSCRTGTSGGASGGGACTGWIWEPRDCGGTTTDPCAANTTCSTCTPVDGCGWCGASSQCARGTATGPSSGSCASGYAWLPSDCTGGGTAAFGEPCASPRDCASGGYCVGDGTAGSGICSRACVDDCGCPRGYECVGLTGSTDMACYPGTNTCPMAAVDAGGPIPGVDAGDVPPGTDAGDVPPGADAGGSEEFDAGEGTGGGRRSSGCGCKVAAEPGTSSGAALISGLSLLALAWFAGRRRRR